MKSRPWFCVIDQAWDWHGASGGNHWFVWQADVRSDDDHNFIWWVANFHEIDTNSRKFYPENLIF